MAEVEDRTKKKRLVVMRIALLIVSIVLLWFCLTVYEYYRVKNEKDPLFCFGSIKDVEDDNEYSLTCYGPLYKYKKYYYEDDDTLSAREFTLFFKEFDRDA